MPYKNKKKQRAYMLRWRRAHPKYMSDYWKEYARLPPLKKAVDPLAVQLEIL